MLYNNNTDAQVRHVSLAFQHGHYGSEKGTAVRVNVTMRLPLHSVNVLEVLSFLWSEGGEHTVTSWSLCWSPVVPILTTHTLLQCYLNTQKGTEKSQPTLEWVTPGRIGGIFDAFRFQDCDGVQPMAERRHMAELCCPEAAIHP